ncbi:hypothetical protein Sango_1061200 [Sesamum angolense]|uniref:Uncharacterized protein n=1 Tax=Sesamum angolense TaxID=2727404 RepID=A0AAE2BZL0_9LAMI|nr:hypothetical protein Sango_1061200 [Sesamum angolense]
MNSKTLSTVAFRLDLTMPPQRDATLLGTPTMRAIPCGASSSRVLFNNEWFEAGLLLNAHFSPPGCLFDHSPDAQLQLESDPKNIAIQDLVGELRKKVVFLAEAERHFDYQKAKLYFLKMGDRNTKYFHDMVKRNAAKSSILAITKSDDSTITSAMEIGQEFVAYFTSHLGTEVQTLLVGNDVFNWGPKLSSVLAFGALQGSHSVGDDLMLFSRGDLPSIHILMECLQEFKNVSGLTRSLRKSTDFGIFFETPEEHQLLGRIFVIPRMKVTLVSGIFSLGTWPSFPGYYGTSTAKQTRCRCSGSTMFISEEDQFGIGNRRRAIHHSSSGLPKSATELLTHLAR